MVNKCEFCHTTEATLADSDKMMIQSINSTDICICEDCAKRCVEISELWHNPDREGTARMIEGLNDEN